MYGEALKLQIQSRILADYLHKEFSNGCFRLTFEDISRGIWKGLKRPTSAHIEAIRHAWPYASKQLRKMGTVAILVSAVYFVTYNKREPFGREAIQMCIAGYGGRKAAGVRLLAIKSIRNDPVGVEYIRMRVMNLKGVEAAIKDRIVVAWLAGSLTRRMARLKIDDANEPALPEHERELFDLMG